MHWIRPLSEVTLADADEVGGKAAHLGALLRAGFPVPQGYVIGVSAFVDHFGQITDPLVRPATPRIQAELMAEVVEATLTHLGHEQELAVRSSSTDEDQSQASFAGQHSTYYFVAPNQLDEAIVNCWMSLWSPQAIAYRRAGWAEISSGEPVRMAVIVQQMVPATRSGVAFSKNPTMPERDECIIEACWGLGAALVDGRVSPDHIRLTDQGKLINYQIADKRHRIVVSPHNKDAQRLQEVATEQRNMPVLSDNEAERIANVAQQLEVLFDQPQDVEWSFVDNKLYLLQSRPISSAQSHSHIDERLVLFKPLAENFTEPLTPMSADLVARVLPRFGSLFEGRYYLNFDALCKLIPFRVSDRELVDMALLRRTPPALKWDGWRTLRSAALVSTAFLFDGANWLRTARVVPSHLDAYRALARRVRDSPKYDALGALQKLVWGSYPIEPIHRQMFFTNISAGRYFLLLGALHAWLAKIAPEYPLEHLPRTYHGQEQMQATALVDAMTELANLLTESLAARDEAAVLLRDAIEGRATELPEGHPFTERFARFIEEFGHRGPREMEFAAPRWREAAGPLLRMLLSQPQTTNLDQASYASHLAARDELHQHVSGFQRRITDWLIDRIGYYIRLRENTRHYHIMAFAVVRQKLLDLERELLFRGLTQFSGDVFFLTFDEANQLLNGHLSSDQAHALIRRRRRQWQRQARQQPTETLNILLQEAEDDPLDPHALQGQCASPGQASGRARIIHSLSQAEQLQQGEILIAPYTDPAWTPLFTRCAGIVVATGSFLSHAGTLARELHIPCVVDVEQCLTRIKTGDHLLLNATTGRVEITG